MTSIDMQGRPLPASSLATQGSDLKPSQPSCLERITACVKGLWSIFVALLKRLCCCSRSEGSPSVTLVNQTQTPSSGIVADKVSAPSQETAVQTDLPLVAGRVEQARQSTP